MIASVFAVVAAPQATPAKRISAPTTESVPDPPAGITAVADRREALYVQVPCPGGGGGGGGGPATTVQEYAAGVRSTFPEASVARTRNWWSPSPSVP